MCPASQILAARTVLDRHLQTKHEGRKIRAKVRALGCVGFNVAGWVRTVETQRGIDAIIRSSIGRNGR